MSSSNNRSAISLPVLLFVTVLLAIPSHLRPTNFIVDDGYFYPQIARHIVHGQGSTFNGITSTNGYHPLWMLVCVGAAWITSASSPLVQILLSVQDLLTFLSLVLLAKICEVAGKRGAFLACMPILFLATVLGIWRLLEANLAFFLQICVLLVVLPIFPRVQAKLKSSRNAVLGVLLGLALLARLDLIFFAGVITLFELFSRRAAFAVRLRAVALQVTCASLVVAPYLIWNEGRFHHLEPVSGAVKSTFPHAQHWDLGLFVWPVICAILLNGLLLLRRERTSFDLLCILTAVAAALHLIFTVSFGGLAPWYLTTGYLTLSLCIMWVTDWIISKRPSAAGMPLVLGYACLVSFLFLASFRLFSNFSYSRLVHRDVTFDLSYTAPTRVLADRLRSTLPADSRLFIFDAPGAVAFYSGMAILPADGLVANYSYNDDLIRQGFAQYAASHDINYFVMPYLKPDQTYDRLFLRGMRAGDRQVMHVEAPLTRRAVGIVMLLDSDLLLKSKEISPDLEKTFPEVGIWKINNSQASLRTASGGISDNSTIHSGGGRWTSGKNTIP